MRIRVVGMDPSLQSWGIAKALLDVDTLKYEITELKLVETTNEAGKVVRKNSDDIRRARMLYSGMLDACREARLAFVEVPVGSQSARAMASYGMCCGVLASCPIPIIEVKPDEVKLAGAGFKTASKEEMIHWATSKFPTAPWLTVKRKGVLQMVSKNEHLADAIAAIEAGIVTNQFRQAVSMMRGIAA